MKIASMKFEGVVAEGDLIWNEKPKQEMGAILYMAIWLIADKDGQKWTV